MLGLLPVYPESPHVNTSWAQTPVLWETIAPLFCHLSSSLPSTAPLGAACIPQAQSMLLSAKQSLPKPTANALSPQISQRLLKNLDFFSPLSKDKVNEVCEALQSAVDSEQEKLIPERGALQGDSLTSQSQVMQ